jgi:hypothetical protein
MLRISFFALDCQQHSTMARSFKFRKFAKHSKRKNIYSIMAARKRNATPNHCNINEEDDATETEIVNAEDTMAEAESSYDVLTQAGYKEYLMSIVGGGIKADNAERMLTTASNFFRWTARNADLPSSEIFDWMVTVVTKQYTLLLPYAKYLEERLHRKPGTIKNHLIYIAKCATWIIGYSPEDIRPDSSTSTKFFDCTIKSISKAQGKKMKQQRALQTVASKVFNREMPIGGLAELQKVTAGDLPWAGSLPDQDIEKETYDQFMGLMYSTFYTTAPQGRISGIADMKEEQLSELIARGFSNSNKFKTASRWSLQPVTMSESSVALLIIYRDIIRPQVSNGVNQPEGPLFLNYNGTADEFIGKRVTRYFRGKIKIKITTTCIRSIVETEMAKAHKRGTITSEQRASVQAINGHTSAVTEDYYVREDRAHDVFHGRSAFQSIMTPTVQQQLDEAHAHLAEHHSVAAPADWPETWSQTDQLVPPVFGINHPDFEKECGRAQWTDAEINYIHEWSVADEAINPNSATQASRCLKHIKRDKVAIAMFHERHTLDSARLRNGFRLIAKKQNKT